MNEKDFEKLRRGAAEAGAIVRSEIEPVNITVVECSIEKIARVCHEVNRAYCNALGDASQPAWEVAPPWQQASAISGVKFAIATPDATPEDMHNSWMQAKIADGWVYGEHKDIEAKTHPCMLPYRELPLEQRVKDYLFRAAVKSLL